MDVTKADLNKNVNVERFFGSLKYEWLLHTIHSTRDAIKTEVEAYIKYYNQDRLHAANGDSSPIRFENLNCMSPILLDQNRYLDFEK